MISHGIPIGGLLIPSQGPGTELKRLLKEWEFDVFEGCNCEEHVSLMNIWGPEGCREQRETIIGWLIAAATLADIKQVESTRAMCGAIVERAITLAEGASCKARS